MPHKIFKVLMREVFIIGILLLFTSCDYKKKQPTGNEENQETTQKLEEERQIQESERRVTELQEATQEFKSTICNDIPKLYSTSSSQDFNLNIYHNTDTPFVCNTMTCQCAYFNGSPAPWIARINSSTEKSKEKMKAILLETCQSHNRSFKLYSCS